MGLSTIPRKGGENMELQDREVCCYVCGRATDHWAEHDDLVGLGLAIYTDAGVEWTDFGRFVKNRHPEMASRVDALLADLIDIHINFDRS
jgi:hypothetical protein